MLTYVFPVSFRGKFGPRGAILSNIEKNGDVEFLLQSVSGNFGSDHSWLSGPTDFENCESEWPLKDSDSLKMMIALPLFKPVRNTA